MASFINTKYNDTVNNLIKGDIAKFNNPYYTFTDKKPTPVKYWNINKQHSTLDEASKLSYSLTGVDSPIKYNTIENAFLYGLEKIALSYENGEWGLEAGDIEGEAFVLPDTFEPIPGDFFQITYLKEPLLFKVTDVTKDTLDTGANFYKIQYKLDQTDTEVIKEDHIVENYKMIVNNVGTQFKAVVRDTTYNLIEQLELHTATLKGYYTGLFFKDRVQTFIYTWNGRNFYDPYMIEFLMRNRILDNNDNYIFVTHAAYVKPTFGINYDRTFFKGLEEKSINKFVADTNFIAEQIMDINSIMSTQFDPYYSVEHNCSTLAKLERISLLDHEFVTKLSIGDKFPEQHKKEYYNIIINYFDDKRITQKELNLLENITYLESKELYYLIPMLIYVVESDIKKMLT